VALQEIDSGVVRDSKEPRVSAGTLRRLAERVRYRTLSRAFLDEVLRPPCFLDDRSRSGARNNVEVRRTPSTIGGTARATAAKVSGVSVHVHFPIFRAHPVVLRNCARPRRGPSASSHGRKVFTSEATAKSLLHAATRTNPGHRILRRGPNASTYRRAAGVMLSAISEEQQAHVLLQQRVKNRTMRREGDTSAASLPNCTTSTGGSAA